MFKLFKKSLILIFIFIAFLPANSQEYGSWDSMVKDYDQYEYGKPVSEEEVQNAIKTIKEFKNKNNKKNQKSKKRWYQIWKKKKSKEDKGSGVRSHKMRNNKFKKKVITGPKPLPKSQLPLLRLPFTVYYGTKVIPQGFYLIDAVKKEQNVYLRFKQGQSVIADVLARDKDLEQPKFKGKSAFSKCEVINNAFVKIYFQKNKNKLETVLPIYKKGNGQLSTDAYK